VSAIAIVGRACRLPGASTPEALWEKVRAGADLLTQAPAGRWGLTHERILGRAQDGAWSDRGGYVDAGFDGLDPVFTMGAEVAQEALLEAGSNPRRTGLVMGNLGFPTEGASKFAESIWRGTGGVDPRNRFTQGMPAHEIARHLELGGGAFALDAACASSLYAIEIACRRLREGQVDAMIAGAVNRCDDLFIHVGFTALQALSKTGQSRPFHAGADGLVPAEGAAFVTLERLEDAQRNGRTIYGVIRGVGLANDGRARGFLAPASRGQMRSMRAAFRQANLGPAAIGYVECHATGTVVGDATELESLREVYGRPLVVGSLKANMGHAITAAGAAGLIKVVEAIRHGVLPPTPHVAEDPSPALSEARCRVPAEAEPWVGPRRAAVSAFGFGGNDAHLLVEDAALSRQAIWPVPKVDEAIVVVGMGVRAGGVSCAAELASACSSEGPKRVDEVVLPLKGLRFPPKDLEDALGQQTLLLAAALEAVEGCELPPEKTGVFVGAQADAEVARYGARWRAPERDENPDAYVAKLQASGVLGTMPNIPANRLNLQLDLQGPSFTVAAEELSGLRALEVACGMLRRGQLDAALVGAVDLSVEPVHEAATEALGVSGPTGDAAVMLVLMRQSVAEAQGAPVLGLVRPAAADVATDDGELVERFGKAHAAYSLLRVAIGLARKESDTYAFEALGDQHAAVQLVSGAGEIRPWKPAEPVLTLRAHWAPVGDRTRLEPPKPAIAVGHETPAEPAPEATPLATGLRSTPTTPTVTPPPETTPPTPTVTTPTTPTETTPTVTTPSRPGRPAPNTVVSTPTPSPKNPPMSRTQVMAPAPALPSVHDDPSPAARPTPEAAPAPTSSATPPAPTAPPTPTTSPTSDARAGLHAQLAEQQRLLAEMHQAFLAQQQVVHDQFLQTRQQATTTLLHLGAGAPSGNGSTTRGRTTSRSSSVSRASAATHPVGDRPATTKPLISTLASTPATSIPATTPTSKPATSKPATSKPATSKPATSESATPATDELRPAKQAPAPATAKRAADPGSAKRAEPATTKPSTTPTKPSIELRPPFAIPAPTGPAFDRAALEVHASGAISVLFGEAFTPQDGHAVQVRMPEPPLLLADRVVGIDAEPASMKKGTVWTETDVRDDAWYLHAGRMPAGVMIESGQADLFLISYLGVDLLNRGERAYRLLGCDLTYHGPLPQTGETLHYAIHVDGHANQGDIRLFFFHYDCELRGPEGARPALSVRNGQAGFFTEAELDDSAGILWTPESEELAPNPRLDPAVVATDKTRFGPADVRSFAAGDLTACFGDDFYQADTHNRTPRIASGDMQLFDEVDVLEPEGGPWGRGYLRASYRFSPDDWFFEGHFKGDPCMPGTLMFEGCLQTMAFYLASQGHTLDRDGWRFEPLPEHTVPLRCRGQALPSSKELVYEVFVEELVAGPEPILYADLLCTVDGLKAFHARRMALRLTPGFPLLEWKHLLSDHVESEGLRSKRCASAIWKPDPEQRSFTFDYASLLACAWGKPSAAFGPMYERFDGTRRVARLPGPPYHFMSRVTHVEGPLGECKPGAKVVIEYDVPPHTEWYFAQNGQEVMPFCVFLEAALQPCGWLASYVGSALTTDEDLSFRNLDGKGTVHCEVLPEQTFRTEVEITNVSKSAGMIIQSFEVKCFADETLAYELHTVFGFFPKAALENQIGLPTTDAQRALFDTESDVHVDLTAKPARFFGGAPRMPGPMLCMIDRVTAYDPTGGKEGLGFLRGEKDVDPGEWFFKAHFFQDPVQPGSLGLEALLNLLQYYAIEEELAESADARFEPIGVGDQHVWKYRGQVVPSNALITSTMEVVEVLRDERGICVYGDGSLWVDGKRIYECQRFGVRIVHGDPKPVRGDLSTSGPSTTTGTSTTSGPSTTSRPSETASTGSTSSSLSASGPNTTTGSTSSARSTSTGSTSSRPSETASTGSTSSGPSTSASDTTTAKALPKRAPIVGTAEHVYDVEAQPWLGDHRPTYTVPALPLMSIVDRLMDATGAWALSDVHVRRWVTVDGPTRTKVEVEGDEVRLMVWRDARDPRLSRFEVAASAKLVPPSAMEPLTDVDDAGTVPRKTEVGGDAYARLFHGPAFRLLKRLERGERGASAVLDAGAGEVPYSAVHPALLDAATHAIPHDRLDFWFEELGRDLVAYPYRLDIALHRPPPQQGEVRCEVRALRVDDLRFPVFRMQLRTEDRVVADMRLKEVALPKGPLGSAPPVQRRTFLQDREPVPGLALSERGFREDGGDETVLKPSTVKESDWLPGTVRAVYGSDAEDFDALCRDVAIKDHVGSFSGVHPSEVLPVEGGAVLATQPLLRYPLEVIEDDLLRVRSTKEPRLWLGEVERFWASRFGLAQWPVADLYYGLVRRFVSGVEILDPKALRAVRGRSVLFLGNHQTGVESLLFSIVASALQGTPTLTLAKSQHRESWLGRLIQLCFGYPGAHDPGVIAFFDREDPASLPNLVGELASEAEKKSLLVHVEGTRKQRAREPVTKMSSVFVDLALKADLPIVPVRFAGGLPVEAAPTRLEFPVGYGAQRYHLGAPIFPETLAAMPFAERARSVMAAINGLGPELEQETPLSGDEGFLGRVTAGVARGLGEPQVVAWETLRSAKDPCPETRRLLAGETEGDDPTSTWLRDMESWLFTPA